MEAAKKESRGIRGMLLNYTGHTHPSSLCSLLSAFSSGFKQSFPFSESLSHSYILYVWNHLQTFHNVRVWGKIDTLAKLFTKLKHFVIFSIRRDKMIPFWKGWCSQQIRELLSITNIIPCVMGSVVWLGESFQFIGFGYQTFPTNSYIGSKTRENTPELRIYSVSRWMVYNNLCFYETKCGYIFF